MLAISVGVSWLGLVRGQEERSSKPQARPDVRRFQAWYRPGSRRTIRKITASGRNGFEVAMARRIPALASPSGSRSPARLMPKARSRDRRIRTTAARTRYCRSSLVMVSSNCWRSWSGCSIVTTGREPRRRQVETVERGILMCLGRHLVPVLTTWFRIRWSYAHRVRDVVAWVSGIAKASPAMAHLASQNINDIGHAALAYTFVRNVSAHSWVGDVHSDGPRMQRAKKASGARPKGPAGGASVSPSRESILRHLRPEVKRPLGGAWRGAKRPG